MRNNVKIFRELVGLSQEKMAELMQNRLGRSFNQSQVSNLEKSEAPPYPVLKAFVNCLNPYLQEQHFSLITVDDLMAEDLDLQKASHKKRVIAFVGGKGGVGKSTLSYNVASAFALSGHKTFFIDLDHQRNSSLSFVDMEQKQSMFTIWDLFSKFSPQDSALPVNIDEIAIAPEYEGLHENLRLVPAHSQLSRTDKHFNYEDQYAPYILQKALENIDEEIVILDCPGGTGILVQNALVAATEVIIPTSSGEYEEQTVIKLKDMIQSSKRLNPYFTVRVVFNKFDYRTKLAKLAINRIQAYYPLFETKIPTYEVIKAAVNSRMPVFEFASKERGAKFIKAFTEEVIFGSIQTQELKRMVREMAQNLPA
ncbi:MAG: AAA family ATPase [SAR324 cluster bacterium]|nr:AAA family ATPase [SAR324 cluster bacterium]